MSKVTDVTLLRSFYKPRNFEDMSRTIEKSFDHIKSFYRIIQKSANTTDTAMVVQPLI
jgi:hypothetical protein